MLCYPTPWASHPRLRPGDWRAYRLVDVLASRDVDEDWLRGADAISDLANWPADPRALDAR
jgi:hypothetical protein